jgi:hypothetical protein
MAGKYVFSGSSTASVVNQGRLQASEGGYIALLGKTVSNEGVISATLGAVAMASGNKITLNFEGNSLVDVTIDEGTLNALVENKGAIKADGGRVIMTAKAADAVLSAQVNNTGVIRAHTMADLKGGSSAGGSVHVGSIKIVASGGAVKVAGKLDASAPNGGKGGVIETSGSTVTIADDAVVTTKAASGESGTWLIDPDGFTIGFGGMSGFLLGALLDNTNITLESTSGHGADGNINVNAPVSWSANTILTLSATNNININAPIIATGVSAGLVMNYGGYATTGSVKAGAGYYINNIWTNIDGSLRIGGASVTLSGANASLSINGQAYTLIHSIDQLAAISPPVLNPDGSQVISDWDGRPVFTPATGFYALAQDLDGSSKTFSGAVVNTLNGTLAGLGHKVSNLTIKDAAGYGNDGLIGQLGSVQGNFPLPPTIIGVGVVRDIGVVNANITDANTNGPGAGNDGALVGLISIGSSVSNAYSIGAKMDGVSNVGGLVGVNQGVLDNGHTDDVNISALNGGSSYGGLAGANYGTISNSSARGQITAAGVLSDDGNGLTNSTDIGGLVGFNVGSIINSHAFVSITATNSAYVGGLVGENIAGTSFDGTFNPGLITGSTASGTINVTWNYVSANGQNYGGLVGNNDGGTIANSSANVNLNVTAGSGTLDGQTYPAAVDNVGGLVGNNTVGYNPDGTTFNGQILDSSSYGNVNGVGLVSNIGGGVGHNDGSIAGLQAYGNVNGFSDVGGLVGSNYGDVSDSTASGTVKGKSNVSGLVGGNVGAVAGSTYNDPAAAAQAAQAAMAATRAGNVIATSDTTMTAATPPNGSQSAAGARKTAAIAGPKIDDNLTIKEPTGPSVSTGGGHGVRSGAPARTRDESQSEEKEPPARRHAAASEPRKAASRAKGAGYGAAIRSIEVDGQRFNLEDNSSKTQKAR